ncbi:lamin tail domain-containing protein [Sphingobacterium sp. LRF_L2]|uniref:lamin tail domain-containing protein n=1 Tax=Sphingobacterium sp. LRF_L2 TaxID=3369421 RepID=UPI003F5E8B27
MLILLKIKQQFLLFFLIFSINIPHAVGQLIITEIMANPSGNVVFPSEYIELYNQGPSTVSLQNIRLKVGGNSIELEKSFLAAKQYLLLTKADQVSSFEQFGNVIGLPTWRSLTNQGISVALIGANDEILDEITYHDSWYGNTSKKSGGWSLERISPVISCHNAQTWRASEDALGGSPGKQNSIWQEDFLPELHATILETSDNKLVLSFNMSADDIQFDATTTISFSTTTSHILDYKNYTDSLVLFLNQALQKDMEHTLYLNNIRWCNHTYSISAPFLIPSATEFNDIVINEILFNPKTEGVDFVEIYNRSMKAIDLKSWKIGNRTITENAHIILPKEYRVLTTSAESVSKDYPKAVLKNFIPMASLPAYPNEKGTVTLSSGTVMVDSLYYQNNMHQPFLTNTKGISLERQDPEYGTNEAGNFSSASTMEGGATPGYQNSKSVMESTSKDNLLLKTKVFYPQANEQQQNILLQYNFSLDHMMLNLTLFNDRGLVVNRLIRNKSTGTTGDIYWNGLDEASQQCPNGIYIYSAEIYNSAGHFQRFKGSFVLVNEQKNY